MANKKIGQLNYKPLEENLKEAISLLETDQKSNLIIEEMYYNTAKNIGKRLEIKTYDQLATKLAELGIGQARVNLISETEIIIRLFECLTCSDLHYIGKAICFFEAGIIAGAVSSIVGYDIDAVEDECQALGGDYCEFRLGKEENKDYRIDKTDKSDINLVNLTLHSLNLAKQYKKSEYKTEFVKFLLDKIDFLEKEMKFYKNKASQKQQEGLIADECISSPKMKETIKYIKKVAKTDATVLLRGESGTGKTTYAQKVHDLSPRNHNPFVYIDCTTIPENFFEAELFGYEPGAFTGARKEGKKGKLATADGGTVFLDEVSEIPAQMQSKLLRFIQEQKFEKIGSTETKEIDVRIIAATNQDLETMIRAGSFRKDLYYRLNVVNISLPALRERWEDIPCLVDNILLKFSKKAGVNIKQLSEAGLKELINYSWPGNIRELENLLQRLSIIAEKSLIAKEEIVKALDEAKRLNQSQQVQTDKIANLEKQLIIKKLKQNNNKTKVAKELGVSRQTLYNKLDKYNLQL